MTHRAKTLIAVLTAVVLCLGTWTAASAALKPAALSATQPATGCATSTGLLRLTNTAGKCPSGTTKLALSRASTAPKAMAISGIDGGFQAASLALLADTHVTATCRTGHQTADGEFEIDDGNATTALDGTTYLVVSGGGTMVYVRHDGQVDTTATGASSFISNDTGEFLAQSNGGYATLNAHLLVRVPHALFTIDLILDVNANFCRISTMVQSASLPT